ncbi:hypothetical protein [Metabacillus idriensis]|uniref:hypothetical protein n=1 Tax=Metabacillus idriensis TaxID=324768 RepID=UPI003D2AFFB7
MKKILNYISEIKLSNSKNFSSQELEDRAVFMGVVAELLLSKELFKRNEELKSFIKEVFKINPLDYLFKSRTLLLSRIIRIIESSEKDELKKYIDSTYLYLEKPANIDNGLKTVPNKTNKKGKGNTIDTIDRWRKVISRNNE